MASICVVGLGNIGSATATYAKERDVRVLGYDISPAAVKRSQEAGIAATTGFDELPHQTVDAYILCVSTPQGSMNNIFTVAERIATANPGAVLSLESTLTPGTSRRIARRMPGARVIHCPHRWDDEEQHLGHGVHQPRVIAGVDRASLDAGLGLYREILDIPVRALSSVEAAELTKVAENAYRYVEIAMAEELRMASEKLGITFDELRQAMNTKWNIRVLEARDGIGGECLPKDIQTLAWCLGKPSIFGTAIQVDTEYRGWLRDAEAIPVPARLHHSPGVVPAGARRYPRGQRSPALRGG